MINREDALLYKFFPPMQKTAFIMHEEIDVEGDENENIGSRYWWDIYKSWHLK